MLNSGKKIALSKMVEIGFYPSLAPPNLNLAQPPLFNYGDVLRWRGIDDSDWGIAIGRFYGYALHSKSWQWCYLLWLDSSSKSAAWCQIDTAWEEDLESYETAPNFATTRTNANSAL